MLPLPVCWALLRVHRQSRPTMRCPTGHSAALSAPKVNPLITPNQQTVFACPMKGEEVKWEFADTFNPAAVVKDGKIYILYRAEDDPTAGIGGRTSRIGLAETADGIHIDSRRTTPVMYPDTTEVSRTYEWKGGCEDPRVIMAEKDGKPFYVMTYTGWNNKTARLCIATSDDLLTWTHHGPAFLDALTVSTKTSSANRARL